MTKEIFQKMAKLEEQLSWTVHPTNPVLPPYGELTKVCGVIERINVEKQENYFSQEDYRVAEYEVNRRAFLNRIAAVASFFSGQVAMLANAGKNNEVKIEKTGYFIHIQISGVVYRGWAGACPFEPGDEVELAVEWQDDHYELYAIARPKDKMISVCPFCCIGKNAYIKEFVKASLILFFVIDIILFVVIPFFANKTFSFSMLPKIFIFDLFLSMAILLAFVFEKNTLLNTTVRLAENIFSTLQIKNFKNINLQKTTQKRLKKIQKETGLKSSKSDYEKKPIVHSLLSGLSDCHLYYYE